MDALRLSQVEGFCLGMKLVRGAYMDKERKLAEIEGRPDPIHTSWEDTNKRWTNGSMSSSTHSVSHTLLLVCVCSYNASLNVMLDAISHNPERYRIIVASHNEESVRLAGMR